VKKYLIVLFGLCVMAGCKKELSYSYAFNVGATAYKGNNYTATYQYDTAARLQEFAANFYIGNVTDTNYVQVSFSGNSYIVPGTYYTGVVNPYNTTCSFAYVKNHVYYANVSGILQIVEIDNVGHTIKGNFQFSAANTIDTVVISNGAFSGINYVIQ
jgi:hypothetical protein